MKSCTRIVHTSKQTQNSNKKRPQYQFIRIYMNATTFSERYNRGHILQKQIAHKQTQRKFWNYSREIARLCSAAVGNWVELEFWMRFKYKMIFRIISIDNLIKLDSCNFKSKILVIGELGFDLLAEILEKWRHCPVNFLISNKLMRTFYLMNPRKEWKKYSFWLR